MANRFWHWLGVMILTSCGAGVGALLGLAAGKTGVFVGAGIGAFGGLFFGGLFVGIGEQNGR